MTFRMAVLGSPIEHSLSPTVHARAYQLLGVAAEYSRFKVDAEGLAQFLDSHSDGQWRGFSLTMPLKEVVIKYLRQVDERTEITASANTVIYDQGGWSGYNSDVFGFEYLLKDATPESVAILGAGGTARAALLALRHRGVPVSIFRRSTRRDLSLRQIMPDVNIRDWHDVKDAFESPLLINAAPIDAARDYLPFIRRVRQVLDALYSPWPPPLMAQQDMDSYISGKDLLVAQALEQIRYFTGASFNQDDLFIELRAAIDSQKS
jgi:shikimate dehydrogenase